MNKQQQQNNQQLKFKRFRFENLPGLDPVTLYVEQHGEGFSNITVRCWGQSWSAGFGNPGCDFILFLADSRDGYMVNALASGDYITNRYQAAAQCKYLDKIWSAVQPLLRAYCETTTAENRWDCTYEK